jgi:hypothetical protein
VNDPHGSYSTCETAVPSSAIILNSVTHRAPSSLSAFGHDAATGKAK